MILPYHTSLLVMIGKVLLRPLDVPDHFPHHITSLDGAKLAAVGAEGMGADHEDFIRVYGVYVLNHHPIYRMLEDDGISPPN